MAIERTVGGAQAAVSLPALRPTAAVGRLRPHQASGPAPASPERTVVFDEAIDIHLGIDRQTGHLAIVGGDVRIEPRLADRPTTRLRRGEAAPGMLAPPPTGAAGPPSVGSLVNVVA